MASRNPELPHAPTHLGRAGLDPVILLLKGWADLLPKDAETGKTPLDLAVVSALDSSIGYKLEQIGVYDTDSFFEFADSLLRWIPEENTHGKKVYDILCLFAFVFDQPGLREYQTDVDPKSIGKELTWLSSWIVAFSQLQGQWLDTQDSITADSLATFAQLEVYEEHNWKKRTFSSFNDFFARELVDGARPIADPDSNKTIVFPADSTFDVALPIDDDDLIINAKGVQWNINDLLNGSAYRDDFDGGVWIHSFLNTFNYHRHHAPVAGKVVEARNIYGAAFVDVVAEDDGSLKHVRRLLDDPDPKQGQIKAVDSSGYQFLQTRGVVIIDTKGTDHDVGLVAVLPIGMSQVSGIVLTVKAGDEVKKGDNIGYFKFGGSDIVVVFQPKPGLQVDSFDHIDRTKFAKVGEVLAEAR